LLKYNSSSYNSFFGNLWRYLVSLCLATRWNYNGTRSNFWGALIWSWASSTSCRSWCLLLSLIRFDKVFNFGIFGRIQASFLLAIIAATSIVLCRLVLGGCILVRKHQVIIFGRRIHELAIVSFVALAAFIGSRVCTLGWPLSFFAVRMHRIIRLGSSFTAQKDGIVVSLILSGTCSFVELLVCSKQLLVDLSKVKFLCLTIVHQHHIVQLRRLIKIKWHFLCFLTFVFDRL